jgi:peptidoglycan/xylan/chitin deacetylase (PgdA/CDA1 family)
LILAACLALAAAGWAFADVTSAAEREAPHATAGAHGGPGTHDGGGVHGGASGGVASGNGGSGGAKPDAVRYRPIGCVARDGAVAHFDGPARREVALTFDDGPGALTPGFVRMLFARHVKATFFMVGKQVSGGERQLLSEELRDGDALGDHTWSHPNLLASGEVGRQLAETKAQIASVSGYAPCVFRPPYGAFDRAVLDTARSLGLATIAWNVDPRDWALPGVGSIEATVLAQVKLGSIVLSHDGGGPRGQTLAAYPRIIAALRRRGYRFVTVPQLLGYPTVYRRCRRECGEAAIEQPPPGSVVQKG